jgi:hypothetical protein
MKRCGVYTRHSGAGTAQPSVRVGDGVEAAARAVQEDLVEERLRRGLCSDGGRESEIRNGVAAGEHRDAGTVDKAHIVERAPTSTLRDPVKIPALTWRIGAADAGAALAAMMARTIR